MRKVLVCIVAGAVCCSVSHVFAADKVAIIPLLKSRPPATSKLIFATDAVWTGNLGGLSGADAKCAAEAKSRGFSGSFQALLGSFDGRPQTRSIHYPVPYFSPAGQYLNSDFHDLFNSGVDNSILPFSGSPVNAWTGLNTDGTPNGSDCNGWASSASNSSGRAGLTEQIGTAWVSGADYSCDTPNRLYCIEQ